MNFRQSTQDPCLFYGKDVILALYVDDVCLIGKSKKRLDEVVKALAETSDLTDEGTLHEYLGVTINRHEDSNQFELTQSGLIEKIISSTFMEDANADKTPAASTPLGKDLEGEDFAEEWGYSSIVGMLMYLANNSRPDIAFAVNQCARFTHNPKKSHGKAVKRIVRYLIGTRDKGMLMTPNDHIALDCYVDADFAGLWNVEHYQDPTCAKSRTGYVILLGGCPLTWTSKLQTEISLSTMESEFVSLSLSLRELLPLRDLVAELADALGIKEKLKVRSHSTVFEDNNGALQLANCPKFTPRSRHYAVKYHFFRHYVENGELQIKRVDTDVQIADQFTRPPEHFCRLRLLIGW